MPASSSRLCPNVEAQHVPGRYIGRVEEVEVEWRERKTFTHNLRVSCNW